MRRDATLAPRRAGLVGVVGRRWTALVLLDAGDDLHGSVHGDVAVAGPLRAMRSRGRGRGRRRRPGLRVAGPGQSARPRSRDRRRRRSDATGEGCRAAGGPRARDAGAGGRPLPRLRSPRPDARAANRLVDRARVRRDRTPLGGASRASVGRVVRGARDMGGRDHGHGNRRRHSDSLGTDGAAGTRRKDPSHAAAGARRRSEDRPAGLVGIRTSQSPPARGRGEPT
jgi:hypothetical protein